MSYYSLNMVRSMHKILVTVRDNFKPAESYDPIFSSELERSIAVYRHILESENASQLVSDYFKAKGVLVIANKPDKPSDVAKVLGWGI